MKALNNIKFVSDATTQFNSWVNMIDNAVDCNEAGRASWAAIGFIDCMTVYLNTMVCEDDNDFTAEIEEMIKDWYATVDQRMTDLAIKFR